ncbi:MAG: hypothetical protein IJ781_00010, partial [Atopobiaceae bacterium]|nr:hypothetical protein [Atopobiaceae bacterium]
GVDDQSPEELRQATEQEVENTADPKHVFTEEEVLAQSSVAWQKSAEGGYEATSIDDIGQELHCVVDDSGNWRVWTPNSGAVEGKKVLCEGNSVPGETRSLGEALLFAGGALENLKKGAAYKQVEKYSIKTPEMQRQVAQESIARSSGSTLDLGNRQHQGI